MSRPRSLATVTALALLLAGVMAVALTVGGGSLSADQTMRSVGSHLGLPLEPLPRLADSIVWQLRTPRVLLAAVAGAGLAASGCVLQAVTRNALADPYLLGISSGASTGAVLTLTVGLGSGAVSLSGGALIGGGAAFALVFALMGRGTVGSTRIVLTGVVVGQLFSAVTSLIVTVWGDADSTRSLTYWLLGSLSAARWPSVILCIGAVVVAGAAFQLVAPALDAFAFGQDSATSMGIDVRAVRVVVLLAAAAATATIVSAVGAIGFVGLIVPHAARLLVGPGHRLLLPVSALAGAVFLVAADLLGRLVFAPQNIPVGVVTALLGVPVFLLILRRQDAR